MTDLHPLVWFLIALMWIATAVNVACQVADYRRDIKKIKDLM